MQRITGFVYTIRKGGHIFGRQVRQHFIWWRVIIETYNAGIIKWFPVAGYNTNLACPKIEIWVKKVLSQKKEFFENMFKPTYNLFINQVGGGGQTEILGGGVGGGKKMDFLTPILSWTNNSNRRRIFKKKKKTFLAIASEH